MEKYIGTYRAKVLQTDENEDDNLGRLKLEVYPMLIGKVSAQNLDGVDGIEIDQLPWAVPAMSLFSGAGVGYGSFVVPEIGSFVWVFFEAGDIYQPVYFAEAPTAAHGLPASRLTNYPDRKVWRTKSGIEIVIDETSGSILVNAPNADITVSGKTVNINP